ncbi:MAG TPA: choice-of-anchor L domain-containing protein, partial [Flavobacterium sp.]|nr:choice-of-anchor L domain-containing protein [Flavobacterium sp.]
MKKLLLILALSLSLPTLSQSLVVDTTTYTVPQLVNTVLINSPCALATNVTWRTGTNFGSSNGMGFFTNANPNFPMTGGVILSTGDATHVDGPNNSHLNDGSANWAGDADLEATLLQAGIPMVSTNATVLEFDFMPISANFSFDFVFASEEYGNYQCQFSDAFAFLLTNLNTGVTTNLAVVPNTNTPISVVTIRDFLYNSSCPSANAQYFGGYNGGSAAAGSATNFNGQTLLMNASAVLVPNTPYHIKLVVADRGDYESDSVIFLSTNSFNIGQNVLGADLTVANGTALCHGTSYTLSTGLGASYSFSWTKDGAAISGANGPSINVTEPGTYGVTYINSNNVCQAFTDLINIEYYPVTQIPDPITIYKCNSGAATYTFNLALNTPIVTAGSNPPLQVSYHISAANAQNNVAPLPTDFVSAGNQTIYIRIKNPVTSCVIVKSFSLQVTAAPVAVQPADWVKCARSLTLLNAIFPLATLSPQILNGLDPAINIITYYSSQANADAGLYPFSSSTIISAGQTIYVRVTNVSDPACYSLTSFNVIVNPLPPVDTMINVVVCEEYILPPLVHGNYFTGPNGTGTPLAAGHVITVTTAIHIFNQPGGPPNCSSSSSFLVTIINPLTLSPGDGTYCGSYTLPGLEYGSYFTQPGGNGTMLPVGTHVTSSLTVYIYYEALEEPFCVIDISFNVTIIPRPDIGPLPDIFRCGPYTLPTLPAGTYYTEAGAGGTMLAPGTVISQSQTIYVHATSNTAPLNCTIEDSFKVIIGFETPEDVSQCSPYTLPALVAGNYYTAPSGGGTQLPVGTVISDSQSIYIYIPNTENPDCMANVHFDITISQPPVDTIAPVVACGHYTLPTLTHGSYYTGSGGTGSELSAGDLITSDMTVYIYAQLNPTCSNESSFTVTVYPAPAIDSRASVDQCNSYVLTPLTAGNYYTGPNGSGTMLAAGTVITESATIYIFAQTTTEPVCTAENSFEIFIFSVEADAPAPVTACDSYTLPALVIGNYYSQPGGPAGGEGNMMFAGDVITASTTIYVYTESGERINC